MKYSQGFTLPEVMVAVFIFVLIIGGAFNLLVSSLTAQKTSLSENQALREESFLAEYMSRALRQARKELNSSPSNCLISAGRGANFELDATKTRIKFLNHDNICQQFFLSGTQVFEQKSSDSMASNFGQQIALTSNNVTAQTLDFALLGENQTDNLQPRVTFFLKINNLPMQITVSQRNFDVQQ